MYSLEFQSSDATRKAGDQANHFPGPQAQTRCASSTAASLAIVLLQTAGGIGSRANVERRVAYGGTEDIHRVKGGDGLGLNGHDSAGETGRSQDSGHCATCFGGRMSELCLRLCSGQAWA